MAPDATAFAHRSARFAVSATGSRATGIDDAWSTLEPHGLGSYLSFDTRPDAALVPRVFPPATLARLRAVKREVDPGNVFRDNGWVMAGVRGGASRRPATNGTRRSAR